MKWLLWNPTGCSCAAGPLGQEGPEGAHSQDVSGWVCLLRLQEEPSACPRNAGGSKSPLPPPHSLSTRQARGGRGHPLGSGLSPAGETKALVCLWVSSPLSAACRTQDTCLHLSWTGGGIGLYPATAPILDGKPLSTDTPGIVNLRQNILGGNSW